MLRGDDVQQFLRAWPVLWILVKEPADQNAKVVRVTIGNHFR